MTMRVKLPKAFRFGFTGTPIDRTMVNTHRDFGPVKDGEQERYLSYYGIKRAIKDGATLEVHYIRDHVPFTSREDAERRLREDVRGDGAGGRRGEGLRPAPAVAMEGAGPPSGARGNRRSTRCSPISSNTPTRTASRRSWSPSTARPAPIYKDALDDEAQGSAACRRNGPT